MRTRVLKISVLLAVTLTLASCGGGGSAAAPPSPAPAPAPAPAPEAVACPLSMAGAPATGTVSNTVHICLYWSGPGNEALILDAYDRAMAQTRALRPATKDISWTVANFRLPDYVRANGTGSLEADLLPGWTAAMSDAMRAHYPASFTVDGHPMVNGFTDVTALPMAIYVPAGQPYTYDALRHEFLHMIWSNNFGAERCADGTPIFATVEHGYSCDPFMKAAH